jgi:hypothetical protein
VRRFRAHLPPGDAPELVRLDIDEVSAVRADGDRTVVSSWCAGRPLRVRQRN